MINDAAGIDNLCVRLRAAEWRRFCVPLGHAALNLRSVRVGP